MNEKEQGKIALAVDLMMLAGMPIGDVLTVIELIQDASLSAVTRHLLAKSNNCNRVTV